MRAMPADLPIRLDDVTVCAGQGTGQVTMLDRISLVIAPGAPTVLIGPNGSGKTTLLRVVMGLLPPSSGRITWDGAIEASPARRAIVFQRPAMLRRSVASNIRYALQAAHIDSGRHEARLAELLSLVGLDALASRPARRLSGGEQQRLALARALARDPSVLLLDEPTASLDPAVTKAIEDIIRAVAARGVKVVMATHDLGEARRLAGDVVFLHRGRAVEAGPAETFFRSPQTGEARAFLAGDLLL
ncbi:ATP-binding cassette domain-containing protein [Rhodoplanes sp. Z2-YC6860]|uniref:ATP-binding cassette domain-containing protein n=1 Tax=Rhodoplanes sp. Z2-YC6860 TaxID=674703 RepID=UPI00078BC5EC|nr:ATP-binding cassette domain-containing protein [Rhodoplanes sp. Z2-YC6860]AMN45185.1 ABC transporter ATP-binding protein [Rhodoplanes sp. Z2-YC6860]